tara:strand:+ start:263 stop:694 length:432 start_codon:yes stop_codon:yes gene_type:complete
MIKYKLNCKKCSHSFDSWFASSKEYEKVKKLKLLNCQKCNSVNIEKTIMAPNIVNSNNDKELKLESNKNFKEIKKKLKEYQKFIKNNFDDVGDNFTYEARSIHYNKKKSKKGIYGKASPEEVKELKDEGIETEIIPWINEKDN